MVMLIDSHERNQTILDILEKTGVPLERKELPVGDFIWNDIAIERKEINDFVKSISTNHIYDQLDDLVYNLSLGASKTTLIVHGDLNDIEWQYAKYWTENTFYKHIGEIFTKYQKVNFFWVPDESAFATMLAAMYHQSFSRKVEHLPFVKKTKNHKVNVLISTKHFSIAQAKRILREYSLRQIFNMSEVEMTKIKGFGKIGVNKFIRFRGKK